MQTAKQKELNEKTYTALGRFVVMFSGVLYAIENATVDLIGAPGRNRMLTQAALADRTASPIVSSFFTVFHEFWNGNLSERDIAIMKCLRRELNDLVKTRNRLMHDAWMTSIVGGEDEPNPLISHRIRAHGEGVEFEHTRYSPEILEQLADEAFRLSGVVNGCVHYERDGQNGPELEKRICVINNKVIRSN